MQIIVTGGAGFIGSHIVDLLTNNEHAVMIIDNLSTGKLDNINKKAIFVKKDIRDNLEYEFNEFKPDIVIHHAAQIDVHSSMLEPVSDSNINIAGSINLLSYCSNFGIRKFIYSSSAAVYGVPMYLSIDENHPIDPLSCYGISKYTPEQYIKIFSKLHGFDYTILRYSNVYGTRQSVKGEGGVVSIFLDKLLSGNTPTIHGDGNQTRDFIYVKDVARANLQALDKGGKQTINVSTNKRISINELYQLLKETIGNISIEPDYSSSRDGDISHSVLDNKLALQQLEWKPLYSLYEGINEAVSYYRHKSLV